MDDFFKLSRDLILVGDLEGRFRKLNPAWGVTLGWTEADLMAMTFLDLAHPHDAPTAGAHLRGLVGQPVREFEVRLRMKSGGYRSFVWTAMQARDAHLIYGVGRDVTKARETAEHLNEQVQFTRLLFEGAPVGMNLCRFDGLWVESNPRFLDMIGYSKAEADLGLTYWQLTPREYYPQEQVQLASLNDVGSYGPYEKEFVRKDGRRIPVRLNGFIVERQGQKFIWSIIEDLSVQRETEKNLVQAAKMSTLGEMASGIAHEINSPLTLVGGIASLLKERVTASKADAEEVVRELGKIEAASERIARIVRSIRAISRNSAADPMQEESLATIVDDLRQVCEENLKKAGVELRIKVMETITLECRAAEVAQVLLNLITNGVDAVRALQERWVEVSAVCDRALVQVSVTDSGHGIPPGIAERIMAPFFTTKGVGVGTGLGLSISQAIVERHHGRLSYDASCGNTRFIVELPLRQPDLENGAG